MHKNKKVQLRIEACLCYNQKNYKDTLFRMIFSNKTELLSLYNAIKGTEYHDPDVLKIVTLENAIYMNMKNDLAFLIDDTLNLYEQYCLAVYKNICN